MTQCDTNWPVFTQYSSYALLIFSVSSDDDDADVAVAVADGNMVEIGTSDDDDAGVAVADDDAVQSATIKYTNMQTSTQAYGPIFYRQAEPSLPEKNILTTPAKSCYTNQQKCFARLTPPNNY